ncbi:hypothetical protein PTKIN_Ptkin04bG0063500 [Pterospermum kingtungense]
MYGFGIVLRDDKGVFIAARTVIDVGLPEVKDSEALGLLRALIWVKKLGYRCVVYELDCKEVVVASNFVSMDYTEFGSILAKCRDERTVPRRI